jgi:heterodisulfide reductase subunit A-like polyferredoxin
VDAIEFLMVGAAAVGVCTAAILKGPQVFGRIVRQMDRWLDAHGCGAVEDVQGLAIRRWQERPHRVTPVPPTLDDDACTGCGLCETSCVYGAIRMVGERAALTRETCTGCGLCVTRCPVRALEFGGE